MPHILKLYQTKCEKKNISFIVWFINKLAEYTNYCNTCLNFKQSNKISTKLPKDFNTNSTFKFIIYNNYLYIHDTKVHKNIH